MSLEKTRALHPRIARDLEESISSNRLSSSLLFYGKSCSGRLTAAFECIQAIIGKGSIYPYISDISMSLSRPLSIEMNYAKAVLEKNRDKFALDLFLSALSKVIISLSSSEERTGAKPILDQESEQNLLTIFNSLLGVGDEGNITDDILPLVAKANKIVDEMKSLPSFSINDIRTFKKTAAIHALNSGYRFYIIEGLEQATVGAKNAFLKLLEEPPENTYFFLIAAHKEELGETILSRLSPYEFTEPDHVREGEVFKKLGFKHSDYKNLEDLVITLGIEQSREIKEKAARTVSIFKEKGGEAAYEFVMSDSLLKKTEAGKSSKNRYIINIFMTTLIEGIVEYMFQKENVDYEAVSTVNRTMNNRYYEMITYNQNIANALYSLLNDDIIL